MGPGVARKTAAGGGFSRGICPTGRKSGEANPSDSIEELAASILAHGLLQNLIVAKVGDGAAPEGKPTYEVVAGSRRHAALLALAKANRISPNFLVPVQVVRRDASTELSLAENIVREPMHPVDEFEAFRALLDAGRGVEEIAARFGVSALAVRQRLRLANVSPRLLYLCRQDQISCKQKKESDPIGLLLSGGRRGGRSLANKRVGPRGI